ncbi:MAG: DUF6325 family protein [Patescibacteria group bacterium]
MRGPIDYIIVGFPGNKFKGEILSELDAAVASGAVAVLDVAVITKDKDSNVVKVELSALNDPVIDKLLPKGADGLIGDDDIVEVGELLEADSSAGLLIVEQLWAKGLKQAILNAEGILLAEGRIHPEADQELNDKEGA